MTTTNTILAHIEINTRTENLAIQRVNFYDPSLLDLTMLD